MARQRYSVFAAMERALGMLRPINRRLSGLLLVGLFLLSVGIAQVRSQMLVEQQYAQASNVADQIQAGKDAYKNDQFADALKSWKKAERDYQQVNNQDGVSESRFYQFQALKGLGMYSQACLRILSAVPSFMPPATCNELDDTISKTSKKTYWDELTTKINQVDSSNQASIWHGLGESLHLIGNLERAEKALEKAVAIALPNRKAEVFFSLGNTERALGNLERDRRSSSIYDYVPWRYTEHEKIHEADEYYKKAADYYQLVIDQSSSSSLKYRAQLSHFSLLIDQGKRQEAQAIWSSISSNKQDINLPEIPSKVTDLYAKISLAKNLAYLKQLSEKENLPWNDSPSWAFIIRVLGNAQEKAKDFGSVRAQSYALGNLGGFYEYCMTANDRCQQTDNKDLGKEAKDYTEQALLLAQPSEMPDIAYQWQWQLGRLYAAKVKGNQDDAIKSYESAAKTLESTRSDLLSIDSDVQFSFRDNTEPLYRDLVASIVINGDGEPSQERLQKAIYYIESLQLAELENRLRCNLTAFRTLKISWGKDRNNPIDRTLEENPGTAVLYPISLKSHLVTILKLKDQPLAYQTISKDSQTVQSSVKAAIDNLKKVPFTKEGEQPLRELYSWIIKPFDKELDNSKIKRLIFNLDSSFRRISFAALLDDDQFLIEKDYAISITSSMQLLKPKVTKRNNLKVLIAGTVKKRQGFDSSNEFFNQVNLIRGFFNHPKILVDGGGEKFTRKSFEKEISDEYDIVHLATHGQFSSDPKETFIITDDESENKADYTINIEKFGQIIRAGNVNSKVIDLLVLSACQTATGDNRAVLGIAGISIRARANSTLATLWKVEQSHSTELAVSLYKNLVTKNTSKAEALHLAQKSLKDSGLDPREWAPFVLIGN